MYINQEGGVRKIARAGGKSLLCRQKFAQDFSFKTYLFLQNILQNLVQSTSKSVMFIGVFVILKEFSYSCLSSERPFLKVCRDLGEA